MSLRNLGILSLVILAILESDGGQNLFGQGRIIEIYPGMNVFSAAAQSLLPGDTLVVHQGIYNETNRMSIQVQGTSSAPITIRGAQNESRPVITRPATAVIQNTINIEGSATNLTIRGLEIIGNGGDGIKMFGAVSYITLEDLVIHDIDVGVNFQSSMNNITVRHNHIYNTGIDSGTGEGMYVGCNYAACIVRDSLIEQNWIHDSLPGTTQGDGIEVKVGSHSNVIRDNVIYNRAYPGVFVYGTGANPVNIVEGNVVWNSLEGIYAVSDAIVRNNIVFNSGTGLSLYSHVQVAQMKNITAVNNTLYNNDTDVYMRWSSQATNMVLANNAIYSPSKTALSLSGSVGTFVANYVGGSSDRALDGIAFIQGGIANAAFVDAANMDFWPMADSVLIGNASGGYSPSLDFNGTSRVAAFDVGAYETNGLASNPGWRITTNFKTPSAFPPPDTTAPVVSVTSPTGGSTVSGSISVEATASDDVGVAGVQFKLDGADLGAEDTVAPYSTLWDTRTASNGVHIVTATARDAAGNISTAPSVSMIVSNTDTLAPTVSITSPATGAVVSRSVSILAVASDNVGVVGVQFQVDGKNLKTEDTSAPFSVSWNTSKIGNGAHILTAIARDAAGNTSTSAGVSVTVRNGNGSKP